jgi:hypothetical protein
MTRIGRAAFFAVSLALAVGIHELGIRIKN